MLYSCSLSPCFQSNILLDDEGKALLSDFGLSNVVVDAFGPLYVTSSIGGSVRWAAPEHFHISYGNRISTVTTHGDIYSYGSVMLQVRIITTTSQNSSLIPICIHLLQVLSGKLPYHHLAKDSEVLITLHHGAHPPRPQELAGEHWELITRCWAEDPRTRPDIKDVFESVQYHYQAAADRQVVHHVLDSAEATTPAENAAVIHGAPFPTLALIILAFMIGSLCYIIP
jgi:serine/threonine protein kinase